MGITLRELWQGFSLETSGAGDPASVVVGVCGLLLIVLLERPSFGLFQLRESEFLGLSG